MKTPILLHIPEPCHENWDAMTQANKGKHCQSCNKIVVDFSVMSDRQVLEYFKTTTGKTCGRFNNDQLQRPLIEPQQKPSKWNYIMASIIGFIFSGKLFAQDRMMLGKVARKPIVQSCVTKGETVEVKKDTNHIKTVGDTTYQKLINNPTSLGDKLLDKQTKLKEQELVQKKEIRVTVGGVSSIEYIEPKKNLLKGLIIDEKNQAIGGATITIKGTRLGTASDFNGAFEMKKLGASKLTLVVSSIGFERKEIEVTPKDLKGDLVIVLKGREMEILREVIYQTPHCVVMTKNISGKIRDEQGNSIPKANITLLNYKYGTISDLEGHFELVKLIRDNKITLQISSIGFETKEINVIPKELKGDLNIVLKENKSELGEVLIQSIDNRTSRTAGGLMSIKCFRYKELAPLMVQKIFNKESIKIYPNPATINDIIHITIKDAGEYALHFFDTQSRLLNVKAIVTNTNNQTTEFQLPSTVATGTYFIRILNEKTQKQVTEKIIIQ